MVLPLTDLKFSQINAEMGRSSTASLSMNDAEGRRLAAAGNTGQNQSSGTSINAGNFKGHARNIYTVAANRQNITVYNDISAGNYAAGKTYVTYTINGGVVVGSFNAAVNSMVINNFSSGDIVDLVNNGTIVGKGGYGGNGNWGAVYYNGVLGGTGGGPGGQAMLVTYPITLVNNGGIWGGGGGGGGADGASKYNGIISGGYSPIAYGGSGGGGAGYDPGSGGGGGYPASAGTTTAGGAPSTGYLTGGAGGGPGQAGTTVSGYFPAGAAGKALTGKSNINGGAGASGDVRGTQD